MIKPDFSPLTFDVATLAFFTVLTTMFIIELVAGYALHTQLFLARIFFMTGLALQLFVFAT
jgi:hypothetical protein